MELDYKDKHILAPMVRVVRIPFPKHEYNIEFFVMLIEIVQRSGGVASSSLILTFLLDNKQISIW